MKRIHVLSIAAVFGLGVYASPVIIPDSCDLSDPALARVVELLLYEEEKTTPRPVAAVSYDGVGDSAVSITVAPLLKTSWAQRGVPDVENDPYYNLRIPNKYPAGCVAVAIAQVMRYYKFPVEPVAASSHPCTVDDEEVVLSTSGAAFDWDAMDVNPHESLTSAGRDAVSALMADVAISLNSDFYSGGTLAIVEAWTNRQTKVVYGISPVMTGIYGYESCDEIHDPSGAEMRKILKAELDAGRPVIAAVSSSEDAGYNHEMVIDGYGYVNGELYHHVNLGVDGNNGAGCNIWYKLPEVYVFNQIWHLNYNIVPPGEGSGGGESEGGGSEGGESGGESEGGESGGGDGSEVEHVLFDTGADGEFSGAAASVYNGFLEKDGVVCGTVQVKAGKTAKNGSSKLTVAITPAGAKKSTAKCVLAAGAKSVGFAVLGSDGEIALGAKGLSGSWNGCTIAGVRNLATSKNAAEKAAALKKLQSLVRSYVILSGDGSVFVATVAKTGKTKVSGTLAGGAKDSAAAELVLGDLESAIPVVMKKSGMSFVVWIGDNGESLSVEGLDNAKVGIAGNLKGEAEFKFSGEQPDGLVSPQGTKIEIAANGKWILPKAGKIAYVRGTTEIDYSKAGDNPCALKLTFKAKDGTFKGSFKVYNDVGGKLKAVGATVTGVVVDGKGSGSAVVKGGKTYPIVIE